jgi:uncharacterized tellurite resistance protein B-like protein
MEEKKRKSSRSFELEKGGKHSFDLQKTSARKFDLEKDSDEVNLEELKKDLLADGKIDAEEVNKLREVLFADGKIDQDEADFLFEINDAVSGKPNDSSWKAFFVEAISDYLLNDEKSPGVIDEEEGKWLVEKIGADGQVDGAEKQLLDHLKKNAKKMPATVTALMTGAIAGNATSPDKKNLQKLKKVVIADGMIDKDEVNRLRNMLYADGKIDQEEADFIFELNDAVSGKKNDPTWNQFFVQAISDYLLNDEKSPGVIDEEEGKWLVEKIGADGQVDGVEKRLLDHLKKNAKKMPTSVEALLNGSINPQGSSVSSEESTSDGSEETKSKKWLWIVLAIVMAAALAYFCFKSCNGNKDELSTELMTSSVTEENDEQSTPNDSTLGNTTSQESSVVNGEASDSGNSPASDIAEFADNSNSSGVTTSPQKSTTNQSDIVDSNVSSPDRSTSSNQNPTSENPSTVRSKQEVLKGSVEEIAFDVIRGIYGNGLERKKNLGDRYAEIQSIVNEMYRKGLVR